MITNLRIDLAWVCKGERVSKTLREKTEEKRGHWAGGWPSMLQQTDRKVHQMKQRIGGGEKYLADAGV